MAQTIVEYMQEHGGYRCGYCGSSDSNFSHGMWAHSLSCDDYQDLIDRGWRRSGCYLYKPLMDKMCCPCYTIRCAALEFQPSKSQKKVLKKMIRFLTTGERPKSSEDTFKDREAVDLPGTAEHPAQERDFHKRLTAPESINVSMDLAKTSECLKKLDANLEETAKAETDDPGVDGGGLKESTTLEDVPSAKKHPKPGLGADPSKPPCKKAKEARHQRRMDRRLRPATGSPTPGKKPSNEPKTLQQLIHEIEQASPPGAKHKLEMRYVRSSPMSSQFEKTFQESYAIYHQYQVTIHKDPPSKPSQKQFKLVRSSPESRAFQDSFKESHRVFAKYQTTIHKEPEDECQETDFRRFLVDSPLREEHLPGGPHSGYGSFHEHFLLDGKIIAVGVIDVLPKCISSVYFYYNPEYSFLSLGTYSALRELQFTKTLHLEAPRIDYYYLGFYVHSCPKMQYKGQYHPSYLLCPEAFTWCPIRQCLPKLDTSKYSRLEETDTADAPIHLPDVRVLYRQMSMRYSVYQHVAPGADDQEEVLEYAQYVGKTCSGRMMLFRH